MKSHETALVAFRKSRGSALLTVVMLIAVMLLLSGSMLKFTVNERRSNERNRLLLRSRNMAENAAIYASEQLTTKLRRLRSPSKMAFVKGSNQIYLPPADVLTTENSLASDVQVKAGLTSNSGLKYIDPKLFPNDPNKGLQVDTATVQIISKSTMRNIAVGEVTTYVEQDLAIDLTPLFQFGVFYNMDMEYGPGLDMMIGGPIHTNGNLIARMQTGKTCTLEFSDRVTAAGGFFANTAHKGSTWSGTDIEDTGPGGTGRLNFTSSTGSVVNIDTGTLWRDHKWGGSTESATSLAKFESFATSTYAGNLRTSVHGTSKLELPAVGSYNEKTASTAGRELVEEPLSTDDADLVLTKISRNAGLYIVVNPDDNPRKGKKPDGSTINLLARSYRCYLSYVDSGGTRVMTEVVLPGQPSYGYNNNSTPSDLSDDTMYQNNLPNRYTDKTAIGINQILRIPASGTAYDNPVDLKFADADATTGYATKVFAGAPSYSNIPDAYFFDMRRATNNTGHPWNRPSKTYMIRPIAKIDFDMTRFRLAVERTLEGKTTSSAIYNPNAPSLCWANSILNPGATPAAINLGINVSLTNFSEFPAVDAAPLFAYVDPFRIYLAPLDDLAKEITLDPNATYGLVAGNFVNTGSASPWSDGISIYVHSAEAEDHTNISTGTPDRVDSGLRLWNGRGPVISLNGANYPKRTGLTIATNDAVYIVGHFNADGTINSMATDNTAYGGFSARYPDSKAEMLAAVMGDAVTILSQPQFTQASSNYYQSRGWSDSVSANRFRATSSYTTSWATINPSASNPVDGVNTTVKAASMPNLSDRGAHPGSSTSSVTAKLVPASTEVAACLLTGIVRTNANQTSGGVHNFPRLLENWPSATLAIRGSMVALFESQVAIEPWSIRAYNAATRLWGLHEALRGVNGEHDVPLEPIVIGAHRLRYLELSPDGYQKLADAIDALPK